MIYFVKGFCLSLTLPAVVLVVNVIKQAFRGGISFGDD